MRFFTKLVRNNVGFIGVISLMFVFRSAVADWNYIPSSSMNPTLVAGDRVLVNKLAYSVRIPFTLTHLSRWDSPHRGDVITFDSPKEDVNLIKRVIAVAGDEVSMQGNQLVINGKPVERQLLSSSSQLITESGSLEAEIWAEKLFEKTYQTARIVPFNRYTQFAPVVVPVDKVLVLGDSRDNSNDSRFLGFIDIGLITGKAHHVVMSHDPSLLYLPRAHRWWLAL